MKKYIDAKELKDSFIYQADSAYSLWTLTGIVGDIDRMEAADVQEVRHGRWIGADDDGVMYKCSVCGEWSCCRSPYCGECGAKMDEVSDEK